jgi:hypothetical protein
MKQTDCHSRAASVLGESGTYTPSTARQCRRMYTGVTGLIGHVYSCASEVSQLNEKLTRAPPGAARTGQSPGEEQATRRGTGNCAECLGVFCCIFARNQGWERARRLGSGRRRATGQVIFQLGPAFKRLGHGPASMRSCGDWVGPRWFAASRNLGRH